MTTEKGAEARGVHAVAQFKMPKGQSNADAKLHESSKQ